MIREEKQENVGSANIGAPPVKIYDDYIGVKFIKGRIQQGKQGQLGYEVGYSDADGNFDNMYLSWSPKDVFDAAYRRCDAMPFGHAIEAMQMGKKVKLPHWGDDVFISAQFPDANSKMTAPYFYVTSRFGLVPWTPTGIEIWAENWQIVE
jgi:hypothetical protein